MSVRFFKWSCSGLILAVFCFCLWGCYPGIPAKGTIAGQQLATGVDDPVAEYYLKHYLSREFINPEWDARIEQAYTLYDMPVPDRAALKELSLSFSPDFAALFFADKINKVPSNRKAQKRYQQIYNTVSSDLDRRRFILPEKLDQYRVIFVPGFLYRRHTITGADFRRPRAILKRVGMDYEFLKTDEDGPVDNNARLITETITAANSKKKRLILVSASKSGAEVAQALTRLGPDKTNHVAAWLNLVGTMQGSILADQELWEEKSNLNQDVDQKGIYSLTTRISQKRFEQFDLPDSVLVINYIGIPVSGSLSSLARDGYIQMKDQGPNDGLSLLPDLLAPADYTLIEMGSDHFLLTQDIEAKTLALLLLILNLTML